MRGGGISQWTQLDDGRWVSEKNPGYPFLAVPFRLLGILRAAPLFYGALGCFALFVGGRRWLGAWGGTWAVGLFCSSGVAITFAWRAWMPTFTGAALVAAGAGALLWALLAGDASARRRTVAGLLGLLALEGAMLIRYTDVVALAVAVAAVLLVWRLVPGRVPRRALWWWLGSVVVAGALVLAWDQLVYGSALTTGYASGVVTFGLGALSGNLKNLPWKLTTTMPAFWLALAGLVWLVARSLHLRRTAPLGVVRPTRAAAHRDLAVAAALAAAWAGNWGLYFTYYWTAQTGGGGLRAAPAEAAAAGRSTWCASSSRRSPRSPCWAPGRSPACRAGWRERSSPRSSGWACGRSRPWRRRTPAAGCPARDPAACRVDSRAACRPGAETACPARLRPARCPPAHRSRRERRHRRPASDGPASAPA